MRLSASTLGQINAQLPDYDRDQLVTGIVHLGIGAFHRAHQAVYVDDLLADDPAWGIVGASLRSADTANALTPQDGLYTVLTKGSEGSVCRAIGSVQRVLTSHQNGEELLDLMAHEDTRIISLTVTEKGYCHDPTTGRLNPLHPDVRHDISHPATPRSAPGYIVEALRRRMAGGRAGVSIMSCDNLASNGQVTRHVVTDLAALQDPGLAAWIDQNVSFPSTMVDRIVPATSDQDKADVTAAIGATDAWPVVSETFSQWVIEDDFAAGRPAFERAGALMVKDVEPFENMKLRMLNGSHSALAYLGLLKGHRHVRDLTKDNDLEAFLVAMMTEEIIPNLTVPEGFDLADYAQVLMARFKNPALQHELRQIACDGSQKLPQRILHSIAENCAAGRRCDRLLRVVAAWILCYTRFSDGEQFFGISDPLTHRFREIAERSGGNPNALVQACLSERAIFDANCWGESALQELLVNEVIRLMSVSEC